MTKRHYKTGQVRGQLSLLPPSLEDYVSAENPVRAIEAYVATLDLSALGFTNTAPTANGSGQPAYDPSMLLKLYLYGYLNRVHSSRRMEREAARNLEVIWLTENQHPCYKTIADFRKNNAKPLVRVNKDFVLLCRDMSLFAGELLAFDGSFFKGDTSKDHIYTAKKLDDQLARLEKQIEDYQQKLAAQDAADDQNGLGSLVADPELADKLEQLKKRQAAKKTLQQQLHDTKDKQLSIVDADARLLSKRGQTIAGYNVQVAVDSRHKLIVAAEVTQDGNDTGQLVPMLEKAQDILQSRDLSVTLDSGYFNGKQLGKAEQMGVKVYLPEPKKEKDGSAGRFKRQDFHYQAEHNHFICPQGEQLKAIGKPRMHQGQLEQKYRSRRASCRDCPQKHHCLPEKASCKTLSRDEFEAVRERHRQRMATEGRAMLKKRSQLVEHPFGTLKHRAGMHHFLLRGLEKCRGEFNLMVLCYNFTRVITLFGADALRAYCEQRSENKANSLIMA